MKKHPHEFSEADKVWIEDMRMFANRHKEVRVPREMFEAVEDILKRIPSYELVVGDDGEFAKDEDGRFIEDYDKPVSSNRLFCSTKHEDEANFMFRGTVVLMVQ